MELDVKFSEATETELDVAFEKSGEELDADFGAFQTLKGDTGLSAYEVAVKNGFEGTEQKWLDSLHGEDGYTPIKGKDYFDGKNGVDGKDGYTPVKGIDYFDGAAGADGRTPEKGVDYFTEADKTEIVNAVKSQLIVEQWTFTLMDDTVVTKDVIVE